ncbi:integrase [Tumebacillus avium]|uniref:Integrase n=1 Tax=Tumebacillus avium TaxID=1903704 RepID=A0A1Y0IN09_9BACL|nr:tyrosine-type recombinase/integrase [Tumebacillus avium]ARU61962.1 integrase [Tumebacillus avium]
MDKRIGKRVKTNRISVVQNLSLDAYFEQFMYAKTAEGRAKRTLEQYRMNYEFFVKYLDLRGVERQVQQMTTELIRGYIVWMLHEKVRFEGHQYVPESEKRVGLSPVTINTRLKTLRVFFRFLMGENVIENDPTESIKNVTEDEEEIRILTVEQLRKLLDAPNQRTYSQFRDYVLMNMLLDTFVRINEALSLKVSDIDFELGLINIRGEVAKSRKSRMIPMQKRTANLLHELIEESKEFDSEFVFLANYGECLEASHFRHRLKEYSSRAGLSVRVHPHLFRHTGATMFLEAGGDLRHLQMILGHRDLRMVMRYTHLSKNSLKKQHEQYSPLNEVVGKLQRERKIMR